MYSEFRNGISPTCDNEKSGSEMAADGETGESIANEMEELWIKEQDEMKSKMIEIDTLEWQTSRTIGKDGISRVAGVDISFIKNDPVNACASVVVLELPNLNEIYSECSMVKLTAPYIAGFLAFREAPHLVTLVEKIPEDKKPEVILVDGNGKLHYRGFGLACQLGVLLDLPTVGVAKNVLHADGLTRDSVHEKFLANCKHKHDSVDLVGESGALLGKAYQSTDKPGKHPIIISVGHKISLETATWVVRQCCKHKNPEPVRQADLISRDFIRNLEKNSDSMVSITSRMEDLNVEDT